MNKLLLNANELSDMLGVSVRQIWRMRDAGVLPPPIEMGKRCIRWEIGVIHDWISSGGPHVRRTGWKPSNKNRKQM